MTDHEEDFFENEDAPSISISFRDEGEPDRRVYVNGKPVEMWVRNTAASDDPYALMIEGQDETLVNRKVVCRSRFPQRLKKAIRTIYVELYKLEIL